MLFICVMIHFSLDFSVSINNLLYELRLKKHFMTFFDFQTFYAAYDSFDVARRLESKFHVEIISKVIPNKTLKIPCCKYLLG